MGYLKGLLSPCERKNGWQFAERLGNPAPDDVQYLLEQGRWDPDTTRDELQRWVAGRLNVEDGILLWTRSALSKRVSTRRAYSASTAKS